MLTSFRRLAVAATIGGLAFGPVAPSAVQAHVSAASAVSTSGVLGSDPELAYWWLSGDGECRPTRLEGCDDRAQRQASVDYDVHYRLQDGTWIGHDSGDWDGPARPGPSDGAITAGLTEGAAIGGASAGSIVGKNLAERIRNSIAAGSRLAPATNIGMFVAYISPWTGMAVGAMGAAA